MNGFALGICKCGTFGVDAQKANAGNVRGPLLRFEGQAEGIVGGGGMRNEASVLFVLYILPGLLSKDAREGTGKPMRGSFESACQRQRVDLKLLMPNEPRISPCEQGNGDTPKQGWVLGWGTAGWIGCP